MTVKRCPQRRRTEAGMSSDDRDERYQRLAQAKLPALTTTPIPITDLTIGDGLRWGGATFTVTRSEPNGPCIEVHAVSGDTSIDIDYLKIERVDVTLPRPDPER